jgi:hypothetical protein
MTVRSMSREQRCIHILLLRQETVFVLIVLLLLLLLLLLLQEDLIEHSHVALVRRCHVVESNVGTLFCVLQLMRLKIHD